LSEPFVSAVFWNNPEHVHVVGLDIIKHADFLDTQTILRLAQTAQSLDSAFALFLRFVPKVRFHCRFHNGLPAGLQRVEIISRILSDPDFVGHFGYKVARISQRVKHPRQQQRGRQRKAAPSGLASEIKYASRSRI